MVERILKGIRRTPSIYQIYKHASEILLRCVGDKVLIHDQKPKRCAWKIGSIFELFIGRDPKIKAAKINAVSNQNRYIHLYVLEKQKYEMDLLYNLNIDQVLNFLIIWYVEYQLYKTFCWWRRKYRGGSSEALLTHTTPLHFSFSRC